jgi:phage gp29-like protein
MIDELQALVEAAPDLATLQRRLTDAYGGLDTDELVRIMSAALALAELKGMAAAREDGGVR